MTAAVKGLPMSVQTRLARHARKAGLDPALIARLNTLATGGLEPDLTLVFDVPAQVALARRSPRAPSDRIETEDARFWERVRDGYRAIAAQVRGRVRVLDASRPPDDVEREARDHITELLPRRFRACPSPRSTG